MAAHYNLWHSHQSDKMRNYASPMIPTPMTAKEENILKMCTILHATAKSAELQHE